MPLGKAVVARLLFLNIVNEIEKTNTLPKKDFLVALSNIQGAFDNLSIISAIAGPKSKQTHV